MGSNEQLLFYLTFVGYGVASLLYVVYLIGQSKSVARAASAVTALAVAANTAALLLRWAVAGRAPLTSGYEFLLAFSFGIAVMYLYAERKWNMAVAGAFVVPVAWMLLAWVAVTMSPEQKMAQPLMPALQSNWLTYHVVTAMFAYGAFAVSFGLGLMYLWKKNATDNNSESSLTKMLPAPERLDEMSYRMIAFGFPLLSLCIITGAIWAEYAWGRYWSWDPKETWSLITWLIYAAYLHARYTYDWKGNRAAIMAIIGFLAVLFTFFGVNYFLAGLHSYGS